MPRQNAEHLRPFLRGRTVREVMEVVREAQSQWGTPRSISRASAQTTTSERTAISSATINRRLSVLKAALRYAWQQGWVADNLSGKISKLAEPPGREVYLTPAQIKRLADAMPSEEGCAAILLLAYTGLRVGELMALTSEHIATGTLTVARSKSGLPRTVPVPSPVRHLVSELPLGLSYTQLHWQFRAARKAAKMPHVRLHDLRHTTASWLVNAGVDLYTVGKILGHLTPTTTARYAHLAQGTLKKAMGRLK
jgi:integrase